MKTHKTFWLALFLGLVACAQEQPTTAPVIVTPTITATVKTAALITSTPAPTGSNTPRPTPTLRPTRTRRPLTASPSATFTVEPHTLALTTQNIHNIVQLKKFGRSYPRNVAWLPSGNALVVASAVEISVLDAITLETIQTIDPQIAYPDVAVSSTGEQLFLMANSVQVWDRQSGQYLRSLGDIEGGIRSFAFSADGRVLAIAGPAWDGGGDPDYKLEIIEVASGKVIYSLQDYGGIHSVAVNSDGSLVVASGERGIEIFEGQTGTLLRTINNQSGRVAFDANDVLIEGSAGARRPAQRWDARTGELLSIIDDWDGYPTFSADKRWLALIEKNGQIQIRETLNYELAQTLDLDRDDINRVAFSPDGQTLAVIVYGGIALVDINSGQITASLTDFTPAVNSVGFSWDSQFLISEIWSSTSMAQLWDIESGAMLSTTIRYSHPLSTSVQSPNAQLRAEEWIDTSDYPFVGAIHVIDTHSDKLLHELVGHRVLDGEGFIGMVKNLVFNWDGSLLASAGHDDIVRVWDMTNGQLLITLLDQTLLTDINFSPDGRYLAISSWDGTIQLWGLPEPYPQ